MTSTPDRAAQARPIVRLLDLLGRRWAMRILWELRGEPRTSRYLRAACDDASPGVVQTRLHELGRADLVGKQVGGGYVLTDQGRGLLDTFLPLYAFAERWAARTSGEDDGDVAPG